MKIGVLTLVPKNNYGGILQATALCGYLSSQGHEVVLINKNRFKKPLLVRATLGLLERLPFQNIKNKRQDYLKTKRLKPFIDKHLPRKSREIISARDLQKLVRDEEFDAVVVGSDQVWRYQYIGDGHHNVFFLDFETEKPVKKIAYAASFGKDKWEAPEHIAEISRLLGRFDAISTREKSGVGLCKGAFGITNAVDVLDPTLLVGAEFYERFFDGFYELRPTKNFTTYILDQSFEKQKIIDAVKAGLDPITGKLRQVNLAQNESGRFYSVEEWLWNIKTAEFVVTDSFHGMVFSILFEKQFIVIGNEERGLSRFADFLEEVGLKGRLVTISDDTSCLPKDRVDYSWAMTVIKKTRLASRRFLCL